MKQSSYLFADSIDKMKLWTNRGRHFKWLAESDGTVHRNARAITAAEGGLLETSTRLK